MENYNHLFEEHEINSTEKIKGRKLVVSNQKKESLLLSRFMELDELFPETINKNETIHLISSDNFGSIELLKVLKTRLKIKKLYITSWSYNESFVDLINSFLDEGVIVNFFIDRSIRTRKSHLYAQMVDLDYKYENFKMKAHHMLHSKITLIETDGLFLSIESSANYSKNQRIENYTITENKDVFNFHKNWMNDLIGI